MGRITKRLFLTIVMAMAMLGGVAGLFCQQIAAQPVSSPSGSDSQLLVLNNGAVIEGFIQQDGSKITVQTPQGSRLVFGQDQVNFVCNTLDESYWGQLARIRATDHQQLTRLFHWCLRQKMFEHAQNQIDILTQLDIDPDELALMARQLEIASAQHQKRLARMTRARQPAFKADPDSKTILSPSVNPSSVQVTSLMPNDRGARPEFFEPIDPIFQRLPPLMDESSGLASQNENASPAGEAAAGSHVLQPTNPAVVQVGYTETIDLEGNPVVQPPQRTRPGQSQAVAPPLASIAELEQMTRAMPRGSLRAYRQHVESVFVRSCTRCHRSDSEAMPLMHAGMTQAVPRRMSQRNLYAILKYIDQESPLSSRLLIAATTPHGGAKEPAIKPGSREHENLKQWAVMVSHHPNLPTDPAEPERMEEPSIAVLPMTPQRPVPHVPRPPEKSLPMVGEIPKLNGPPSRFTPRDEFDPEIFNRRYGRQ